MKMKTAHFETLKACMLAKRKEQHTDQILTSMELEPAYSNERIRWDWLYATRIDGEYSRVWVARELYPYLNDSHIDTALRKITGLR